MFLKKLNLNPVSKGRGGGSAGKIFAAMLLHDLVLKQLNSNLLTPRVAGANICYHVAAFMITFN